MRISSPLFSLSDPTSIKLFCTLKRDEKQKLCNQCFSFLFATILFFRFPSTSCQQLMINGKFYLKTCPRRVQVLLSQTQENNPREDMGAAVLFRLERFGAILLSKVVTPRTFRIKKIHTQSNRFSPLLSGIDPGENGAGNLLLKPYDMMMI